MTRKRYVKLLMAKGWSRNEANEEARGAQEKGQSYESDWRGYVYLNTQQAATIFEALNDAFASVWEDAVRITKALAAGVAAFGEAVARELDTIDAEQEVL